jgi:mannosyltransferase
VFARRLRLLFTSASQRRHSAYSRWLIARMDAVVATSDRGAGYLQRPATVIMHGIDTEAFSPAADRPALRARLGLPGGVLVGCYGRIRSQKGTDLFVRAMIEVARNRPEVTGLVMGRATEGHGAFLDGLRAEVAAAGLEKRILFLPEVTVDAMADWYRVLDLYVAPQRWEGFGLTPLEAMACAVPVVAADVGAFAQLIVPEAGQIVAAQDQAAITAAVRDWAGNAALLAQRGEAARTHVLARHGIEAEADALCAVYRQLLSGTGPA